MSSYRSRRIDRSTAERLLDGDQTATDTHADTATALIAAALSAAAEPARPEELAGEQRVLAAYANAAQLGPHPESRREPMLKTALAKALTVKAALVVAALGASGVALAAGTGALPTPWSDTPADPPATSRANVPSTPPSATPAGRPSDAGKPAGAPSPSMTGLCNAYTAEVAKDPGKALDSPAFEALITAAGGADEVPAYCADLTKAPGKPSDLPTPAEPGAQSTNGNAPSTLPSPSNRPETPGVSAPHPADPSGVTPPRQGG